MARKHGQKVNTVKQGELGLSDVRTALYIRVSTEKQATEGYGLDAQRAELDAYCQAQGWNVAPEHVYIDAGVSGKTDERPAFQAMMQAAKAGQVQRIAATKLDRVARNLKNLLQTVDELKGYGCALVIKKEAFDTSTVQGMFVLQMLGAVAELERGMIGERVQSGRVENAKQGGYNGSRCPIGYEYINGAFVVVEDRADVVRFIFRQWNAGQSLNAIVRGLNDTTTPTPSGKPGSAWTVAGLRHILSNGAYCGLAQWDGVEAPGVYPAIISQAIYDAAHDRLEAMRRGRPVGIELR